MIVTTTSGVERQSVHPYLGIVCGEAHVGALVSHDCRPNYPIMSLQADRRLPPIAHDRR